MSKTVNEHYKKLHTHSTGSEAARDAFVEQFVQKSLITDLGNKRITQIDQQGDAAQIIGYGNNSPMHFTVKEGAVEYCKIANDELYAATQKYPGWLYGYATLPVADVVASVAELERCVTELGFKGAIFNGGYQHTFLDAKEYFSIFEKATELNVPIYLHPHVVSDQLTQSYYTGDWPQARHLVLF